MDTAHLRQASCLIVEDEAPVTEALRFVLHRAGWATQALTRGADVMPALAQSRCDVIILDLGLPDMSGLDVLRQIRANPATAALPVVVVTAACTGSVQGDAMAAGATGFVTKPFSVAAMVERLGALTQAAP